MESTIIGNTKTQPLHKSLGQYQGFYPKNGESNGKEHGKCNGHWGYIGVILAIINQETHIRVLGVNMSLLKIGKGGPCLPPMRGRWA